jgi:hypothetical protein
MSCILSCLVCYLASSLGCCFLCVSCLGFSFVSCHLSDCCVVLSLPCLLSFVLSLFDLVFYVCPVVCLSVVSSVVCLSVVSSVVLPLLFLLSCLLCRLLSRLFSCWLLCVLSCLLSCRLSCRLCQFSASCLVS